MPDNNQNNHSWRNRLNELETLPGEAGINKTLAWEKLQQRLQPSRVRRKIYYRYWAAACILAALLLPLALLNHDQAGEKINIQTMPMSLQVNNNDTGIKAIQHSTTIITTGSTDPEVAKTSGLQNPLPKRVVLPTLGKVMDSASELVNITSLKDAFSDPSIIDSNRSLVLNVIQQKKLRVVHINAIPGNEGKSIGAFGRFIKPSRKDLTQSNVPGNSNHVEHILIRNINPQN